MGFEAGALLLIGVVVCSCALALSILFFWQWRTEKELARRMGEMLSAARRMKREKARQAKTVEELERTKAALMNILDDLMESYERLKGLDQLKSDFVANVSHELRTPLTSMQLSLDLLDGEKSPKRRAELMKMMKRNVLRLKKTVDGILDFSAMDAGKGLFEMRRLDFAPVAERAAEDLRRRAEAKGLRLVVKLPKRLMVKGDRMWLSRVVSNLVSNAVKFTDSGTITVSARKRGNWVEVSVKDTGRGISKKNLPKLFDKFVKLEKHTPGSGIGLWMCRKAVLSHGGKIRAESTKGRGSEFIFTIPTGGKK